MSGPEAQGGLLYVAGWLLANGTSVGAVWKFLTAPIHTKIEALEKRFEEKILGLDRRFEKIDGYVNPRASMIDSTPTVGELVRRLQELEEWKREVDGSIVTDEEFREYTVVVSAKLEKLAETLGWIKGRLGGKVE